VSDQNPPPEDVEELEQEIEQLEERVEVTLGGDTARKLRRMRRQVQEATPDALFSAEGGFGVKGLLRRTDSYGFVLVLLAVLIWVFVPFASAQRWATLPVLLVFFLTVLISMHTSLVRRKWLVSVLVVDITLLVVGTAGVIIDNDTVRALSNAGFGALLFATALVVLRRVLGHDTVTSRTLSGAVAAFLFVGLAFSSFAEATVLNDPTAYSVADGNTNFGTMLYYSFVTIATLGYGDVIPVSSTARSLATLEAVMGQIYLVTIVARLVSLLGLKRITTTTSVDATDS
jgi:hypothetical protein